VGGGDVTLVATARSGSGYRVGALRLDPLVAIAAGTGNARVELDAAAGEAWGTRYHPTPATPLSLENAVDAIAGAGAEIALVQSATSTGGATSVLDVAKSAALLDLEANARGGDAHISLSGSNDAGDVRLGGEAVAGRSGAPSDASAVFDAETRGDGHDIEIGSPSRSTGARGSESTEGRGGDANVEARANALGNGAVTIDVVAEGGGADWSEPGGYGGNAWTSARGQSAGTQSVTVAATARGGGGGYDWSGPGGDATSQAEAIGLGATSAHATARAGYPGGWREKLIGGGASALARATGSVAEARAVASSSLPFDGEHDRDWEIAWIELTASASLPGHASVGASTDLTRFPAAGADPTTDAFVRAAFAPESALLDLALAGNPRAQATLPPARPKLPIALVEVQARSRAGAPQVLEASIVLDGSFRSFDDQVKAIQFSFLDPELDSSALASLTLRSWDTRNPADIYEITFATALDALAFLDDRRLVFGGVPHARHLEIILETTGADGDFFLDLVVAAVPEPSLAALLALALLAAPLARRVVASRPS
jgi:hypothetical protein